MARSSKRNKELIIGSIVGLFLFIIASWILFNAPPPGVEITDLERKIKKYKVKSGYLQVSLGWNTLDDLDLILVDPNGYMLWYKNRQIPSGGFLDMDANLGAFTLTSTLDPLENTYFPYKPAKGIYRVYVNLYARNNTAHTNPIPFEVRVLNKGRVKRFIKSISNIYHSSSNPPDYSQMIKITEFRF
jgi:hypothetical protein